MISNASFYPYSALIPDNVPALKTLAGVSVSFILYFYLNWFYKSVLVLFEYIDMKSAC